MWGCKRVCVCEGVCAAVRVVQRVSVSVHMRGVLSAPPQSAGPSPVSPSGWAAPPREGLLGGTSPADRGPRREGPPTQGRGLGAGAPEGPQPGDRRQRGLRLHGPVVGRWGDSEQTCAHTHMGVYRHTHAHHHTRAHRHRHTHAQQHARMRTGTGAHMHTSTHGRTGTARTGTGAHTHTSTYRCTGTGKHRHGHTHAHQHARAHRQGTHRHRHTHAHQYAHPHRHTRAQRYGRAQAQAHTLTPVLTGTGMHRHTSTHACVHRHKHRRAHTVHAAQSSAPAPLCRDGFLFLPLVLLHISPEVAPSHTQGNLTESGQPRAPWGDSPSRPGSGLLLINHPVEVNPKHKLVHRRPGQEV